MPDSETVPERMGREGDTEPMPVGNDYPVMHDLVSQDLQDRLALGIKRYGQPLQPFNGRDATKDAYDEILDLVVYFRQLRFEREESQEGLDDALRILLSVACPDLDLMSAGAGSGCATCQQRPSECARQRAIAAVSRLGGRSPGAMASMVRETITAVGPSISRCACGELCRPGHCINVPA